MSQQRVYSHIRNQTNMQFFYLIGARSVTRVPVCYRDFALRSGTAYSFYNCAGRSIDAELPAAGSRGRDVVQHRRLQQHAPTMAPVLEPEPSEVDEAAVADVLGTLAVSVAVIFTSEVSTPKACAATWAIFWFNP